MIGIILKTQGSNLTAGWAAVKAHDLPDALNSAGAPQNTGLRQYSVLLADGCQGLVNIISCVCLFIGVLGRSDYIISCVKFLI